MEDWYRLYQYRKKRANKRSTTRGTITPMAILAPRESPWFVEVFGFVLE